MCRPPKTILREARSTAWVKPFKTTKACQKISNRRRLGVEKRNIIGTTPFFLPFSYFTHGFSLKFWHGVNRLRSLGLIQLPLIRDCLGPLHAMDYKCVRWKRQWRRLTVNRLDTQNELALACCLAKWHKPHDVSCLP